MNPRKLHLLMDVCTDYGKPVFNLAYKDMYYQQGNLHKFAPN